MPTESCRRRIVLSVRVSVVVPLSLWYRSYSRMPSHNLAAAASRFNGFLFRTRNRTRNRIPIRIQIRLRFLLFFRFLFFIQFWFPFFSAQALCRLWPYRSIRITVRAYSNDE